MLRDDESVASPQEKNTPTNNAERSGYPDISDLYVISGDDFLDGFNLSQASQEQGWQNKVQDNNFDFVLSVEAQHGLLLLVARRFENVVTRLSEHQRGDTEIHGLSVRGKEDGVAIQEDRR